LAKPNYRFEKQRRDARKKKKQEEKRQRKLEKRAAAEAGNPIPPQDAETPQ
jgi:hypothetical protein